MFCLYFLERFGELVASSLTAGLFPFGEQGGDTKLVLLPRQAVYPLKGAPMRDHQQGQGGKRDVGAWEEGGQAADREENRLPGECQ